MTRKANLSPRVGQARALRKPPKVLNEAQEANNEPKFYVNYDDFEPRGVSDDVNYEASGSDYVIYGFGGPAAPPTM